MQPEGGAMAHARVLSLPDKAVIRGAYAKPCRGTDDRHNRRRSPAEPKIEAPYAAGDGRRQQLVDHDPTAPFRVLDGEDSATWQEADREAGGIDDPREPKLVSTRRRQVLCW